MPEYEIICGLCLGTGVLETYIPGGDKFIQENCPSCEGKGYITEARSLELYKRADLQPKEKNAG